MTLASCDLSTFLQLRPLAQPVHCRHQLDIHLILTWPTIITKSASRKTQPRAECAMPPSEPFLPVIPEPLDFRTTSSQTKLAWSRGGLTHNALPTI